VIPDKKLIKEDSVVSGIYGPWLTEFAKYIQYLRLQPKPLKTDLY